MSLSIEQFLGELTPSKSTISFIKDFINRRKIEQLEDINHPKELQEVMFKNKREHELNFFKKLPLTDPIRVNVGSLTAEEVAIQRGLADMVESIKEGGEDLSKLSKFFFKKDAQFQTLQNDIRRYFRDIRSRPVKLSPGTKMKILNDTLSPGSKDLIKDFLNLTKKKFDVPIVISSVFGSLSLLGFVIVSIIFIRGAIEDRKNFKELEGKK